MEVTAGTDDVASPHDLIERLEAAGYLADDGLATAAFLALRMARTAVDARTVICVLTHDPKFDVPLLEAALSTPATYIGVMGSRRTHDDRMTRLRERGVTEAQLARMSSPVGLDIGARTPEETAVSIVAEIVAARWGGTGRRLRKTAGPIHHDRLAPSQDTVAPARSGRS